MLSRITRLYWSNPVRERKNSDVEISNKNNLSKFDFLGVKTFTILKEYIHTIPSHSLII